MKTCFLILHYNEIELTKRAVYSILSMSGQDREIVIVDNCSPNGSGRELINAYISEEADAVTEKVNEYSQTLKIRDEKVDIHIILNDKNAGFSAGNNVGYRYIKKNIECDFIVALNNDIYFLQWDFCRKLEKVYFSIKDGFYLAGPDVYTPNIRSHISPLTATVKKQKDVEGRLRYIEAAIKVYEKKFDFAVFTRYLQDKYQGTRALDLYNRLRKKEYDGALPYNEPAYDCVLNGACLIFDKRYIKEYDVLFEEKTFLYAEEDFLTYRLYSDNKKIRYCPELIVDHVGQGSAGFNKMSYRAYCEKNINTQKTIKEAFIKYLEYIKV